LDEIEKAHPRLVGEMLLAWIDDNDGFVQDKKESGTRYPTKDAIFVLTSNCFASTISNGFFEQNGDISKISEQVLEEMNKEKVGSGGSCDAFRKEELMRRLQAGHAMSDLQDFGFVVFTPPTMHQIDEIVLFFLRDYKKKHFMGSFFWTQRALVYLQKLARRVSTQSGGIGGLSKVSSTLANEVTKTIRIALEDCELDLESDLLLVHRKNSLQALITTCSAQTNRPQADVFVDHPYHSADTSSDLLVSYKKNTRRKAIDVELDVEKEQNVGKHVEDLNSFDLDESTQWALQRYFEVFLLAAFAFFLFPSLFATLFSYLLLPMTLALYLYIFQQEAWAVIMEIVNVVISVLSIIWPIVGLLGFRGYLLLIPFFIFLKFILLKILNILQKESQS
jgi:ATP-dependent Clp protease ATP-binding subunit ClpA